MRLVHRIATVAVVSSMAVAFCALLWTPSQACINSHGTDLEGKKIVRSGRPHPELKVDPRVVQDEWRQKFAFLQQQYRPDADFKIRSDYAAALIHLGRSREAVPILENVEKTNPGHYITASNLGTAYELVGENEKALEWIKKGMERNADSHEGSEWIHVRILEAKIALAKDPDWLKSHSTLGLNFGKDKRPLHLGAPAVDHSGKEYGADTVAVHIAYQLHERLAFVSAPEPIVADLLFDLANLHATTQTLETALPIYDMALNFQPVNKDFVQARRDVTEQVLSEATASKRLTQFALGGAAIMILGLLFVVWRRQGSRVV